MQTLDSCTKEDEWTPLYNPYRGGVRVENLINKFKSETKFDTMSKNKSGKIKFNTNAIKL